MSERVMDVTATENSHDSEWFYATKPTRWTLFLRTFLPWQAWRFLWINAKMIKIIRRGHSAAGRR